MPTQGLVDSTLRGLAMSRLATLFDPPDDTTPDELRARLRALADLVALPIAAADAVTSPPNPTCSKS